MFLNASVIVLVTKELDFPPTFVLFFKNIFHSLP